MKEKDILVKEASTLAKALWQIGRLNQNIYGSKKECELLRASQVWLFPSLCCQIGHPTSQVAGIL